MKNSDGDALICLKNLNRQSEQKKTLEIKQNAHLRELAAVLAAKIPTELLYEEGEQFRKWYLEICEALGHEERVLLCEYICKVVPSLSRSILELKSYGERASVVYVKNALADIAFEKFSRAFERAQVYYTDDFESALEDVYYSRADYTMLPVSSDRNGLMLHFLELILRYEMKIVLCCEVHSIADDSINRFVLLSRNNAVLTPEKEKRKIFEFILSEAARKIPCILSAAEKYDCELVFVQTMPTRDSALIRYDVTDGNTDALCLYLFLEAPSYLDIGLYKCIE